MAGYLRAKRMKVDLKDLPAREKILTITSRLFLSVFAWLFAFMAVASLISSCVMLVLVMYKVYCGQYTDSVKLCAVLVTMVLINVLIEPPQRKV